MSDSIPTLEVHSPKQEEDKERGRGEGEGEEKAGEVRSEEWAPSLPELTSVSQLKGEQQHQQEEAKAGEKAGRDEQEEEMRRVAEEADGGGGESKGSLKLHTVFALVRSRVRSQGSAAELHRGGILGVVQQATLELARVKGEDRPASRTSEGASSGAEQGCGRLPVAPESGAEGQCALGRDEKDLEAGDKGEGSGGGGEEVLRSVEALRRELKEETTRLRLDMQLALAGLEARLTHSLRAHANTNAHANTSTILARQPASPELVSPRGAADRRPRPPVILGATAVPAGHVARRRTLYRTLTTLATPNCPPLSLAPRSRSEPLGGRTPLVRRMSNGGDAVGRLLPPPPPPPPPPPTHPPPQHGRKPLRSKTRLSKPAS